MTNIIDTEKVTAADHLSVRRVAILHEAGVAAIVIKGYQVIASLKETISAFELSAAQAFGNASGELGVGLGAIAGEGGAVNITTG